tara:strand:- start:1251 stop:1667 length:417 start_codon:yes stop_codon:yes gene_type:complete
MNEFKGDKRSKSYKAWKKNHEADSNGLGDKVEKAFKKVGIDKAAKFILGEDCGCDERKNTLNKMFPSRKIECLLEEEYNYLDVFFKTNTSTVKVEQQQQLVLIYNRVFNERASTTSCGSCFLNGVYAKLKDVFNQYND